MSITLRDFTNIVDAESSKYYLMSKFKEYEKQFDQSKVFPSFQTMINLQQAITGMLLKREEIFNREYKDKLNEEDELNKQKNINEDLEKTFQLMEWALPYINQILETGKAIYEFVEENIRIESIGISSEHNKDGYIIIPDNENRIIRIIKYENTLHNCLKTREIDNIKWNIIIIPKDYLKNHLLANDILNQIIYYLDTELNFPYRETIYPVAKRKFINFLEA
jgi:hypothetical protein